MKDFALGEFEEIVLLTVGILQKDAYGVAIKNEIEERAKRSVSVGALHSALKRMEKKGYLQSRIGETDKLRGGKPKRYYEVTAYGKSALIHSKELRLSLWDALPKPIAGFEMVC